MQNSFSLRQLTLDVWLLEQLRAAGDDGLSLEELKTRWSQKPSHKGTIGRTTLARHRKMIEDFFGIIIKSSDKRRYRIANPEQLALDSLANDLLASMQEYLFLDEYRDLGSAIQPAQIWAGMDYLHHIGDAIRERRKLHIRYQKFTDEKPYDAVVYPYCLKASLGRWYLLAVREMDGFPRRMYALDRTLSLHVMDEKFKKDRSIDVKKYFRDYFGIYVDPEHFPVQNVKVKVPPFVAKYWRTLPLHHSQKEIARDEDSVTFKFHISPSPDFMGELRRWEATIVESD